MQISRSKVSASAVSDLESLLLLLKDPKETAKALSELKECARANQATVDQLTQLHTQLTQKEKVLLAERELLDNTRQDLLVKSKTLQSLGTQLSVRENELSAQAKAHAEAVKNHEAEVDEAESYYSAKDEDLTKKETILLTAQAKAESLIKEHEEKLRRIKAVVGG